MYHTLLFRGTIYSLKSSVISNHYHDSSVSSTLSSLILDNACFDTAGGAGGGTSVLDSLGSCSEAISGISRLFLRAVFGGPFPVQHCIPK